MTPCHRTHGRDRRLKDTMADSRRCDSQSIIRFRRVKGFPCSSLTRAYNSVKITIFILPRCHISPERRHDERLMAALSQLLTRCAFGRASSARPACSPRSLNALPHAAQTEGPLSRPFAATPTRLDLTTTRSAGRLRHTHARPHPPRDRTPIRNAIGDLQVAPRLSDMRSAPLAPRTPTFRASASSSPPGAANTFPRRSAGVLSARFPHIHVN